MIIRKGYGILPGIKNIVYDSFIKTSQTFIYLINSYYKAKTYRNGSVSSQNHNYIQIYQYSLFNN